MTVPQKRTISPAEILRAQEVAKAQRKAERKAKLDQAREWAEERAKHAIPMSDPAYWYVIQKIRDDQIKGYKIREPWCYEARVKRHLTTWREATQAEPDHVVYYIKVGKYIKIGTSKNVEARVHQYPPGSKLLATERGGYAIEAERHKQFGQYLAERKEWFSQGPELMAHIKNLRRIAAEELRAARHVNRQT